jgi:hypothetical protein
MSVVSGMTFVAFYVYIPGFLDSGLGTHPVQALLNARALISVFALLRPWEQDDTSIAALPVSRATWHATGLITKHMCSEVG